MNKLLVQGKTKDVYQTEDSMVYKLIYKDTATGTKDGKFDPGENQVGLEIKGLGSASLRLTNLFFDVIEAEGIRTHRISSDESENSMTVQKAELLGPGLEWICRRYATGSFIRRYGDGEKIFNGMKLPNGVEVSWKNDSQKDPMINCDYLAILGILDNDEYDELQKLTQTITDIVADVLLKFGIELWDIKVEFGLTPDAEFMLIDEISAGSLRAYKDGKQLDPMELARIVLEN